MSSLTYKACKYCKWFTRTPGKWVGTSYYMQGTHTITERKELGDPGVCHAVVPFYHSQEEDYCKPHYESAEA